MMLFGHILFGTMALIGVFLLEVGFRKDFQELNLIQRLGIIFTIVGMFATVAMGIYLAGNVLSAAFVAVIGILLVGFLVVPSKAKN